MVSFAPLHVQPEVSEGFSSRSVPRFPSRAAALLSIVIFHICLGFCGADAGQCPLPQHGLCPFSPAPRTGLRHCLSSVPVPHVTPCDHAHRAPWQPGALWTMLSSGFPPAVSFRKFRQNSSALIAENLFFFFFQFSM